MVFIFISLMTSDVEHLFIFLLTICISSLKKPPYWGVLELSFMSSLSDVSLVNIFFHSVGCLFVLLMVSFTVQKHFSLMYSHLFIFSFAFLAEGDISKKNITEQCQRVAIAYVFF